MQKRKIGVLTFSDGRKFAHDLQYKMNKGFQDKLVKVLEKTGEIECVPCEIIWTPELARTEAKKLAAAGVEATILNFAIWAFPHLPAIATEFAPGPFLCLSNVNPQAPGLVAMLAAAGSLNQIGVFHGRVSGDVEDPKVLKQVMAFLRAASAVNRLRGKTYGLFGGRSMGMYTAVPALDQWRREFGVDIEHIDQWEIVRRADEVDDASVTAAREWLERHAAGVHYDGERLTPAILERQIRSYYVMRSLIDEWNLDFCGIKAQPELTENFATMDITEAFLNDPYDWDGPKEPIVCSTEADMDGALTMQILKSLSATPVLFADVRHYHNDLDIWDLCNSGQHATWFAARNADPLENMRHVNLYPEDFYFAAGGASVQHLAAPGDFTFARLTRLDQRYRMHVLRGRLEQFDEQTNERLMRASTYVWPHAFAHFDATPDEFLGRYGSNHIHAVPGDHVAALREVCRLLDVDFDGFGGL